VIQKWEAGTEAVRLEEGKEAEGTAGAFLVEEGMVVLLGASWVLGIHEAWGTQGEAGPKETQACHQGKGGREVVQGTHLEGVLLGRMEVLRGACQEGATCPMEVASQMEREGQHKSVARHHKHLQYSHLSQEPWMSCRGRP